MSKDRIIAEAYYDERHGFGSLQHTLKKAKEVDPSITYAEVKKFLDKQEVRQTRKPTHLNSFVADLPRQEFQIDLADFGANANPRYCFVAIDIFSKKLFAMPLKARSESVTAIQPMLDALGYPISIMNDEGGEFLGRFSKLLHSDLIEQIYSRTGGRFVERVIRTLKMALHLRTQSFENSWHTYLQAVVDQYNERLHSGTGATPNKVAENEYDMDVIAEARENLEEKAKFHLKHPPLKVGDLVKIRVKPRSYTSYKETFNSWTTQVYKILGIDDNLDGGPRYRLEGYHRSLLRYELKKVLDVQRPNILGGKLFRGARSTHSLIYEPPSQPPQGEFLEVANAGAGGAAAAVQRRKLRLVPA